MQCMLTQCGRGKFNNCKVLFQVKVHFSKLGKLDTVWANKGPAKNWWLFQVSCFDMMKTCGVYNLWKLLLMCWLLSGQCWTVVDSFSWVPDEASSTLCCAIWRKNRLLMLCFCYVLWCVLYITYANNTCIVVKSVTTPLHLLNKSHRLLPVLNTVTGFSDTILCFCHFLSFISFAWKILNQMGVGWFLT